MYFFGCHYERGPFWQVTLDSPSAKMPWLMQQSCFFFFSVGHNRGLNGTDVVFLQTKALWSWLGMLAVLLLCWTSSTRTKRKTPDILGRKLWGISRWKDGEFVKAIQPWIIGEFSFWLLFPFSDWVILVLSRVWLLINDYFVVGKLGLWMLYVTWITRELRKWNEFKWRMIPAVVNAICAITQRSLEKKLGLQQLRGSFLMLILGVSGNFTSNTCKLVFHSISFDISKHGQLPFKQMCAAEIFEPAPKNLRTCELANQSFAFV